MREGEKKLKTGKLCDLEREEAQSAMTTAPARMQMKARIGVDLETLKTWREILRAENSANEVIYALFYISRKSAFLFFLMLHKEKTRWQQVS